MNEQWRIEQFPVLLRPAVGGQAEAGRAIAGPRPILRSNPQRRGAGGHSYRVGHIHAAVRAQAGPPPLRRLPRRAPRRVYTGDLILNDCGQMRIARHLLSLLLLLLLKRD